MWEIPVARSQCRRPIDSSSRRQFGGTLISAPSTVTTGTTGTRCPARQRSSTAIATAPGALPVRNALDTRPLVVPAATSPNPTRGVALNQHAHATSTTHREDPRMNHQTRRDDLPDTPWASDALCVDMPAEIFDGTNARLQTAKAACAHCTVARQCLRWAITTEIDDEVWGGRTPAERRRITVAFVLDPPPMSSEPGLSRPVDPVGPEIPSEPIAEPRRRVGQGCAPQEAVLTGFNRRRCPRPQDSNQRSGRVRDRSRLQTAPPTRRADL